MTIEIEPANYEIKLKSYKGNRKLSAIAAQYIPSIFPPNQKQHSESMLIKIIDAASNFQRDFNVSSPNAKDTAKRRVDHKQWETVRVIYSHKSWDELWSTFKINHPTISAKIVNKKSPKVHPIVF